MPHANDAAHEHTPAHVHHHACANLFGCGDELGTGIIREDIKEHAFDARVADRLLHMSEVHQETFDRYLSARGRWRRSFLRASSFMGALAAVGPWFAKLALADQAGATTDSPHSHNGGRVHVVPSTRETVRLGVFDANLPPILTIESGDFISFPNTWSHFSMQCSRGCRSRPW